jgi:hypothetical protein
MFHFEIFPSGKVLRGHSEGVSPVKSEVLLEILPTLVVGIPTTLRWPSLTPCQMSLRVGNSALVLASIS